MKTDKTLAALVDNLEKRGDSTFLVHMKQEGFQRKSYRALAETSLSLARGLQSKTKEHERAGLFADPGLESIAAALGIIRSGMSLLLMDVQLSENTLQGILSDSGVRLVFTSTRYAGRLESADSKVVAGVLDAKEGDKNCWKRFFAEEGDLPDPSPEDEAVLFYTSGTTGPPKGVPLTHGNLVFQLGTVAETGLIGEKDRLLLPLPLHHVYPFVIGILVPLSMGLTIVLPRALTGPELLRAMSEGKATAVLGVPRLYRAIFSGIRSRFSSRGYAAEKLFDKLLGVSVSLRKKGIDTGKVLFRPLRNKIAAGLNILASGGAALDSELAWKLEGLGWNVAIGYGLTETSPLLTINPPGSGHVDSIGKTIPMTKLRFDPSAVPGQSGDEKNKGGAYPIGEIMAKGPGVFSGYLNLPEKTREAFDDGWFKTGDLGYRDDEGYVYVTGRASTLIVTEQGENVQPDEVEKILEEHPVISEAGVLQRNGGLVALLVPDPGQIRKRETKDVREALRRAVIEQSRKLSSYQRPSDFAVTRESLPRTRLGKIQRHLLEERYTSASRQKGESPEAGPLDPEDMSDQDRNLIENDEARQTWQWLAGRYSSLPLSPDTDLRMDLGVDSMEWLNITMEIREKTGVEINDEAIGKIETVRDLLRQVAESAGEKKEPAALNEPEKIVSGRQTKFVEPLRPGEETVAEMLFKTNRLLMKLMFKLEVRGADHIPEGQAVFTPNHVSYLDPFALASALSDRRLKNTYWSGFTGAAFHNPVNAFVSRMAKTIPVDPEKGVFISLASAALVLKRGKSLVWFPEGRRSPSGRLQAFRPGIGVLLQYYDVPVIPVFISGTQKAMPVGSVIPVFSRVIVTFGEQVRVDQLQRKGEGKEVKDKITSGLHKYVFQLRQQERKNR